MVYAKKFALLMWLLGFSLQGIADQYHYKNLLVGTRAMGLGGAYHALSNDLSAVLYNPAGLVSATDSNSASLSTFAWERSEFQDVFSTGEGLKRSSFTIVPSFLGLGGRFDNWRWSLAFTVPDLSTERNYTSAEYPLPVNGQIINITEFASIDVDNSEYELVFGLANEINQHVSYGFSISSIYRQFISEQGSGINQALLNQNFGIGFRASRRLSDKTYIVSPSLGILLDYQGWRAGVKLAQDFAVEREYSATHNIVVADPLVFGQQGLLAAVGTVKGDTLQTYPLQASLGLAYSKRNWTVAVDVDRFTEVDVEPKVIDPAHPAITRDMTGVTNLSFGIEYKAASGNQYRLGWFTDNANIEIDQTNPVQRAEVVDLVGVSFAVQTTLFDYPFTIGSYYKQGDGLVRVSDIRVVENLVGVSLYPERHPFDTTKMTKEQFVIYVSANF